MPNLPASLQDRGEEEHEALRLARGVERHLADHGFACLSEFALSNSRRLDLLALGPKGELLGIEVKSSLNDFRSDRKWPEYLDYCDQFFFAVAAAFPQEILPEDQGLIVADAFGAEILRTPEQRHLAPARRKALTLRFGLTAGRRLSGLKDPPF